MNDLDLADVDDLRLVEARRRADVLRRYVAITRPSMDQTRAHAEELGVQPSRFYRLVRSWRVGAGADLLGVGGRGGRRKRPDGVAPEVRTIVENAMRELGAGIPLATLDREVGRRCSAAGVRRPSKGAIWTYQMDARSERGSGADEQEHVLVARCAVKVPVAIGDGRCLFPDLALVMLMPSRRIVAHDVGFDEMNAASVTRALTQAIDDGAIGFHEMVVIDQDDERIARRLLLNTLGRQVEPSTRSTTQKLAREVGRTIGGMRILFRRHAASMSPLLRSAKNAPLDVASARSRIAAAIARHNRCLRQGD